MKRKNIKQSKTLFRFFEKRISSFVVNARKAELTGFITDIHNTRVDMKKISALMELFEKIGGKKLKWKKLNNEFSALFQKSGKIREVQLNIRFLEKFHFSDPVMISYRLMLDQEEKSLLRDFQLMMVGFDERDLEKVTGRVRSLILEMDREKFSLTARKFIHRKTEQIRKLQGNLHQVKNAHRIRKNLKAIATVVTSLYLLKPDENTIRYLADLNRTEKLLGAWHDKVIFLDSIGKFIENFSREPERPVMSLQQLKAMISEECDQMFGQINNSWAV